MLVHTGTEDDVLDFFVAMPGRDGAERGSELVPIPVHFTAESAQVFHIGAASCGVPGTAAGLEQALERFGCDADGRAGDPAARLAREGVEVNPRQAYFLTILEPILTQFEEAASRSTRRAASILEEATSSASRARRRARAARRRGRGAVLPRRGRQAISEWVVERGGTLGHRGPRRVRADRARAGRGRLPRPPRCSPTRRRRRAGS